MYALPVEILLIILDQYPLKNARLICSTITNEYQNKYWHSIVANKNDVKNYNKEYCIFHYDTAIFNDFKIKVEFSNHMNIIYECRKNYEENLDIISEYNILVTKFKDFKYQQIIKDKILDKLKTIRLGIYSGSLQVFNEVYLWLLSHWGIINNHFLIDSINEYNDIDRVQKIYKLRPRAKILYNMIYNYINEL